jgi:o-succinylbenzoate synthase
VKLGLRRLALATPQVRDAQRAWPTRQAVLLSLEDERGACGRGEASPLPGYSPDSVEQAQAALAAISPAQLIVAFASGEPWQVLAAASALLPATVPAARMALESAALDLLGQQRGTSAPGLLEAPLDSCALAYLLGPAERLDLVQAAEQAWEAGYRQFKLKVGAAAGLEREVAGIARLRAAFGRDAGLRIDANATLSRASAQSLCDALEPYAVELFEEPSAEPGRLQTSIPIALDESLQGRGVDELETLLAARGASVVVLKPMALGGLIRCWNLAERARVLGATAIISHTFDGPLALRAASALALRLGGSKAHGLAPHAGLSGWNGSAPPTEFGRLVSWSAAGLGEPAKLEGTA